MIFFVVVAFGLLTFASGNKGVVEIIKASDKSNRCFNDIRHLIQSEDFNEMLSYWTDFSKDYLYGNSFDFGDFDSCLTFKNHKVQPQHCLIQYRYKPLSNHTVISVPPKISGLNVYWKDVADRFSGGVCVPDSCTSDDVRDLMSKLFGKTDFEQTTDYDQKKFCQRKERAFEFDTLRVVSLICMTFVTLLVVIGTLLTNCKDSSICVRFFQCFSITANFRTLKDFSTTESTIHCLNGIKAISLLGIFIFHSLLINIYYPYRDGKDLQALLSDDNRTSFIIAGFVTLIDTFMIVSGVLIGRSLLRSEKLGFWKFCIQRYMRLTLLTLVLVCYNALNYTLFKLITPRPYLLIDFAVIDDCRDYWWTAALNIQTYVNPKHMCMPQAWYASVLFQLIVLAVLVHLILRNYSRSMAFLWYATILAVGAAIRLVVFIPRDTYFDANLAQVLDAESDITATTYFPPFIRILPFFGGIFLAHILEWTEHFCLSTIVKLNKLILYLAFYLSVIFIVLLPLIRTREKTLAVSYTFMWIAATMVVIYTCHRGHGGLVNRLLSLKIWILPSKMSLSIYLVSLSHQGTLTMTRSTPATALSTSDILIAALIDALFAVLPTVLIYTTVECSITNLANLITGKEKKSSAKT